MQSPADLKEVLQIIHSRAWFSCSLISASKAKHSGGTIIHLQRCRLARRQPQEFVQALHEFEQLPAQLKAAAPGRNPNHALHFTRNLELPGNQLFKVYPLFIFRINGREVV